MRGTPSGVVGFVYKAGIIPAYAGNTKDYREHTPHVRDHPRVCGEHCKGVLICGILLGSSPRMRGTPSQTQCAARPSGIIPAYAGNTVTIMKNPSKTWDHPRVCGEHCEGLFVASGDVGSSPRMRGTPARYCASRSNAGIIPAYAGNTSTTRARRCLPRDHPRVCGEHQSGAPIQFVGLGIIPAYAGNTIIHNSYPLIHRDHPRVCGEHRYRTLDMEYNPGSSPRMRGTRLFHPPRRPPTGIIPAYAGNTWWAISPAPTAWDHPRVCGEHVGLVAHVCEYEGSSPRMRGTLGKIWVSFLHCGIIPAYAGNTPVIPRRLVGHRDHPRVCGEHRIERNGGNLILGSSPRMRGTLFPPR